MSETASENGSVRNVPREADFTGVQPPLNHYLQAMDMEGGPFLFFGLEPEL